MIEFTIFKELFTNTAIFGNGMFMMVVLILLILLLITRDIKLWSISILPVTILLDKMGMNTADLMMFYIAGSILAVNWITTSIKGQNVLTVASSIYDKTTGYGEVKKLKSYETQVKREKAVKMARDKLTSMNRGLTESARSMADAWVSQVNKPKKTIWDLIRKK